MNKDKKRWLEKSPGTGKLKKILTIAAEKEDQKAEHNRTQYHDQESLPTGLVGSPSTQHVGYWNFRREAVLEVTSDASSVQACWWNSKK